MDTLDWDATPIIRSESYSWKNQQQQMIKDSLMMSNSYLLTPVNSKVNALINPIQQQCHDIGDLNAPSAMILQEFGAAFDPIHVLSSWNIPQRQEAATRLAADSVAAKSGAGSSRDCTKMGPPPFSPPSNMLYFGNDQLAACALTADDLGSNNRLLSKNRSLDCLLSANNTSNYTDTSVEDDGISMIFSDDSKSLWNTNNDDFADSSGESAIDAFNSKPIDVNDSNNIECPVNETDQHNNPIRSSEVKRHMTKRRYDRALLQRDSSTRDSGFQLISEIQPKSKKPRSENKLPSSANQQSSSSASSADDEPDLEAIAQMKEMIYCAAAFRPVSFGTEAEAKKPKRKNVRISTDPQTVAARQRREKISEKIKILQKMVPGGSKMDTASMLDEAANYLKFLRSRIKAMEAFGHKIDPLIMTNISSLSSIPFNYPFSMQPHFPLQLDNPVQRPYS